LFHSVIHSVIHLFIHLSDFFLYSVSDSSITHLLIYRFIKLFNDTFLNWCIPSLISSFLLFILRFTYLFFVYSLFPWIVFPVIISFIELPIPFPNKLYLAVRIITVSYYILYTLYFCFSASIILMINRQGNSRDSDIKPQIWSRGWG
jgi:hypothetical protein